MLEADAAEGFGELWRAAAGLRGLSVIRLPSTGLSPCEGLRQRQTGGTIGWTVWCGQGLAGSVGCRGQTDVVGAALPLPRFLLSAGLTAEKTAAAIPTLRLLGLTDLVSSGSDLSREGELRGDVKESAIGSDAPATGHLRVRISMEQSALSSAGISP